MDRTNLTIKGMSCQHCVDRVTKAIKAVPGVAAVQVDLGTEQALVEFDSSKAGLADLTQAVEKSGYKVLTEPGPRFASRDSCCG